MKVLIENTGAENAGEINISFDPQYQKLYVHEVKILRGNQVIDQLQLSNFKIIASETESSRFIYNGTYSAYLILDDLRKGDKIVTSYSLKGFNPVFGNKFFDSYSLQYYEPIGVVHVSYMVPKERSITFRNYQGAVAPKEELKNGYQYYSWEETDLPGYDYEDYTPAWYNEYQWIECSEFKSWHEVGQWAKSVNEILPLEKKSPLQMYADNLWREAKEDLNEYFRLAVDFVQNEVRYMGVEIGEYSHRANSPHKVFNQRYGDCKDKSVLLATLLTYKGIDASLVLAHTYRGDGIDKELHSPGSFNHMVLQAKVDGRVQFIDPTITNQAGNIRYRYFPYYGQVLVLNDSEKLKESPKEDGGRVSIEEKYLMKNDGTARLEVKSIYTRYRADNIRSYFMNNARKQIQKDYLAYYSEKHRAIVEEKPIKFIDDGEANQVQVLEYYSIDEDFASKEQESERKYVDFYASPIANKFPDIKPNRKGPVSLDYPFSMDYTVLLINPDDNPMGRIFENDYFNSTSYYLSKNISSVKDTLRIRYEIGIQETHIDQKQLKEYYTHFKNKDQIFYSAFYVNDDGTIGIDDMMSGSVNPWVLCYTLLLVLGLFLLIKRYNKTTPSSIIPLSRENIYIRNLMDG